MAAVTEPTIASVNSSKKKIFGTQKKPDMIIYRLVKKNDKLRDDTPPYPPYKRFPNTDIISWNYGTDDKPEWGERAIRFLPGYSTIFVDEQEKNGRVLPENVINNPNNRFEIINGEIRVRPHEAAKIYFLDICNRNVESEHRTGKTEGLFARYSEEKRVIDLQGKQKLQKEAIEKAFTADENQVAFHAKYLGISTIDPSTAASRTYEAVLADYRQMAIDNPKNFLDTFDDQDLKLKFHIETAIETGVINLKLVPGKAVFSSTKEEICDVPVSQDLTPIVDALFIFSQGREGAALIKKIVKG